MPGTCRSGRGGWIVWSCRLPHAASPSTHPRARDILLAIEVADTSLEHDRDVKVPLYAAAGVPEVWLVNLTDDAVTLYRDPVAGRYATVHTGRRGETVTSLRLSGVTLRVEDILG